MVENLTALHHGNWRGRSQIVLTQDFCSNVNGCYGLLKVLETRILKAFGRLLEMKAIRLSRTLDVASYTLQVYILKHLNIIPLRKCELARMAPLIPSLVSLRLMVLSLTAALRSSPRSAADVPRLTIDQL